MVSHRLPSLADVPVEVVTTPYGRPALQALQRAVAQAKGGDALAPVTVVVPSNHVGVTARRLLAAGSLGPVTDGGTGVDRKSTRLNSSHVKISYAVFCLKKKTTDSN